MDFAVLGLATVGLFVAGVIKGATGLGYASCALPFLVVSLGLKPAMALVVVPAMATNLSVALASGHVAETARRFGLLYMAMLPGIAIGLFLLLAVSQAVAVKTLGLVIVAYGAFALLRPQLRLSARSAQYLQVPTGFLNGVMTGMTGAQVMPLFPYMMALDLDPPRMVQAINLAVLIATAVLGVGLAATGIMTVWLLFASVAGTLPALAGVECGFRARSRLRVEQFRRLAICTLVLVGALMLIR